MGIERNHMLPFRSRKRNFFQAILLIVSLALFSLKAAGQKYSLDTVCGYDTTDIQIGPHFEQFKDGPNKIGIYRAIFCSKYSRFGMRLDIGRAQYYYNGETRNWLRNHGGLSIGFIAVFRNWNIGFRFKPWTVNPGRPLVFGHDTLTAKADLNPIKLDYYVGYSYNILPHMSIEPYLGYVRCLFKVINEKDLKKSFSIPNSRGLIAGVSINKYFKIQEAGYLALFGSVGYSFVDFGKSNPILSPNYYEWSIGVAIKSYFKVNFYNPIRLVKAGWSLP